MKIDLGKYLIEELIQSEPETVSVLSLHEDTMHYLAVGLDAEVDGASLRIEKGDNEFGESPFDIFVF